MTVMCASGNSALRNARNTRVQEYKDVKRGNRNYGNTLTSMCGSSIDTGVDDTLRKYDQTKIQEHKRLLALLIPCTISGDQNKSTLLFLS